MCTTTRSTPASTPIPIRFIGDCGGGAALLQRASRLLPRQPGSTMSSASLLDNQTFHLGPRGDIWDFIRATFRCRPGCSSSRTRPSTPGIGTVSARSVHAAAGSRSWNPKSVRFAHIAWTPFVGFGRVRFHRRPRCPRCRCGRSECCSAFPRPEQETQPSGNGDRSLRTEPGEPTEATARASRTVRAVRRLHRLASRAPVRRRHHGAPPRRSSRTSAG